VAKTKQPNKTEQKAPEKPVDETLDMVLKDFNAAWDYTEQELHDRWTSNWKLYHNIRVKVAYSGITDTFVPMVFGTVETLKSALFGSKPKFSYIAPHTKKNQDTTILNALLDYYWEKDQWSLKVINTGMDMLNLGTGVDFFYWDGDHPCMLNIPLRDFFIDPYATSLKNARFLGRRFLTTLAELKDFQVVDPKSGEMVPKYKNLDQLEKPTKPKGSNQAQTSEDNTDQQEKNYLYGSTTPDSEDQVEVIEYWSLDKTISVANRGVVIEDGANIYKAEGKRQGNEFAQGLKPFAAARNYVDSSLYYAKGETDFIGDEQELLNDITNQNIDAVTFALNPMYTLDPDYADSINDVENLPGAVYPFKKDALNRIDMGTVSPSAYNERQNIKNEIRETTASNEIVKGVPAEGGKTTATEINAQVAGAGQRINLKVTQLENEYFYDVATIVFRMVRLFVKKPQMVRIVGKDGVKWDKFDPKDFQDGEYEPRIQLDIEVQNQKKQDADNAKEMMAAFLNDQDVNQVELKKMVLAKGFQLDPDEVETLMQPNPAPPATPGMGMAPAMGALPPGAVPQAPGVMSGAPQLPPNLTQDEMQLIQQAMAADQQQPQVAF
jgi:hypothetical protein